MKAIDHNRSLTSTLSLVALKAHLLTMWADLHLW